MRRLARVASLAALAALALLGGCGKPDFSDAEKKTIASLALNTLPALKSDTTNQYADVPGAAALGSTLFFDVGMSRDGTVSCSTCHKIDRQFQDDLPQAIGVIRWALLRGRICERFPDGRGATPLTPRLIHRHGRLRCRSNICTSAPGTNAPFHSRPPPLS